MPPETLTLDQYRAMLERQNLQAQIQQNLQAQQTFQQTQQESAQFSDRSKLPAFQKVVSQIGQKTPEQMARENDILNQRLVAAG